MPLMAPLSAASAGGTSEPGRKYQSTAEITPSAINAIFTILFIIF
jgi:hypothetical protein